MRLQDNLQKTKIRGMSTRFNVCGDDNEIYREGMDTPTLLVWKKRGGINRK